LLIVQKRDGRKVKFDKEKIKIAVIKAFIDVDGKETAYAKEKAREIANYIESLNKSMTVEEIQDHVENKLMASNRKDVARKYIIYRNNRTSIREKNTQLMKDISEKLNANNVQNQNANVDEKSFGGRVGEASDTVLKKYALDNCMSEMARNNHLNNEIYIHDLNSYAVGMHNCYDSATKFVTKNGVKRFGDCTDGQKVVVVDKDGNWRDAIVRQYGKQKMYDLTFTSSLTTKKVTCTRNHRWVLSNGETTDNIQIGDQIYLTPPIKNEYKNDDMLWCFGFVLGDGVDFYMRSKDKSRITNSSMQVRLCGHKIEYLQKFMDCGWSIRQKHSNGDITLITRGNGAYKQAFLENKMWNIMTYESICNIFEGFIHADGHFTDNGSVMVSVSDERIKEFIETTSSVAGYYIWSFNEKYNDTNYKEGRILYEFYLVKKQSTKWTLTNITASRDGENGNKIAWCVEEPITHTFTLDGCMVTGNCLSVPFDKLLAEGFNTRQTDVRPAQSASTAFQLVAVIFQLQSLQQFGGVSATHLDWTMIPYVRKSFYKHYLDGMKYIENMENDWIETNKNDFDRDNPSIKEPTYFNFDTKAYKYAMDKTEKEVYQAVEGLYHNLNTLQSRSGNQLPFTSINYGTCTEAEGRMVTKALLEVSINGIGRLHKTSIFPCGIFQCMKGVNRKPGDPNYDLFRLALKSTAQRLYPNYANVDWSGNEGYDRNDPKTFFSTMGCVEGNEIITYKFKDNLYVESFKRMWNRLSDYFDSKKQINGDRENLYLDVDNVKIYDTEKGFVAVKRVIRNTSSEWLNVKMSHGRSLICTIDHPFHTSRGRVRADELKKNDVININPSQYYEENLVFDEHKAWLLGFILCDGCYDGHLSSSIAFNTENDIEVAYIERMKECFNSNVEVIERNRGIKGNYKDLCSIGNVANIIDYLSTKYEGLTKARRHIPNEVFSWNYNAKLSFLAGMVDADGYINPTTHNGSVVQIGSTNKELVLQQMALAQSLGMPCAVYQNHYSKKNPNAIRYRVEFAPSDDLLTFIVSQKKLDNYVENKINYCFFKSEINSVTPINNMLEYSYDVETESDHFEVSGIYSHNCRTANGWDINGFGQLKDGRGNICPVTIIMPTLAKEAEEYIVNNEAFWGTKEIVGYFMQLLDQKILEAKDMLLERFEWICSQSPDSAKFMYENGVMEGYDGQDIRSALKHGTLAIGQLGLAETLQILIGCDHTDKKGMELAKQIEQLFKDRCAKFKEQYKLNFGVYYTPAENLCFTAMEKFQEKYGVIPNVSDKKFFTNSIHVPVWIKMTPTEKIDIESQLTGYSSAGCITYVELESTVKNNLEALEAIVNYAMDKDIPYFAVNVPNDMCVNCGYTDEIGGECPICGCCDIRRLRRVTGYLTGDYMSAFNEGKQQEVKLRVKHE